MVVYSFTNYLFDVEGIEMFFKYFLCFDDCYMLSLVLIGFLKFYVKKYIFIF